MIPWWVIVAPYLGITAGIVYLIMEFFIAGERKRDLAGNLITVLIGLYLITISMAQLLVRKGVLGAEVYAGIIWFFLVLIGVTTIHTLQKRNSMRGPV